MGSSAIAAAVEQLVTRSRVSCLANRERLAESRARIAASRRLLNPAFCICGSSEDPASVDLPVVAEVLARRTGPVRVGGAILAKLVEVNGEHIILSNNFKVFLEPTVRCEFVVGTPLQVVYTGSEDKKVAIRIERSKLTC
jgi:hypothetical protein